MPILSMTGGVAPTYPASQAGTASSTPSRSFKPFGADGFTFKDILDVINPLQQLPIIGSIYRHITGDQISPVSRVVGGFLLGGPIGAAISAVSAAFEQETGKGLGERVLEALEGKSSQPATGGAAAVAQVAQTGSKGTAAAPAAGSQRPGGWIINAAYGPGAVTAGAQWALAQTVLPGRIVPAGASLAPAATRPRPGGWIINAAYGGFDASRRAPAAPGGNVDVSA